MIYIGIDPGKKGGITVIINDRLEIYLMPIIESDISNIFRIVSFLIFSPAPAGMTVEEYKLSEEYKNRDKAKAIIEAVHAFPGQGVTSMFTFGRGYGFLRGCLVSLGIPFEEVSPRKWQSYFGLSKNKGETQPDYKKRILQKAQNMFPNSSVALQTADSLMLAEYLRRIDK